MRDYRNGERKKDHRHFHGPKGANAAYRLPKVQLPTSYLFCCEKMFVRRVAKSQSFTKLDTNAWIVVVSRATRGEFANALR
mmetsp:Transcript_4629/g.11124  ORF Transcript_4629/g.11124 Transcript_4629/m.11124 type:complete len:81 (+) Transcript_4629:729-971(+)